MRAVRPLVPYLYAIGGVALITAGIGLVQSRTAVPNLSMVYLLLVLWLGARRVLDGAVEAALDRVAP